MHTGCLKNCYNLAHTKPLFWMHLLDVQGVGTYLLIFILKLKKAIIHVSIILSHEKKDDLFVLFYHYFRMPLFSFFIMF